ncbi:hypothetical protein MRB53_017372 [Persea americana]|uniref:Uncharacterized protein n=1 Tax=Persea americana TaxID=3435 RepID=A0ACC2M5D4_PERAE|nr:hypothetical protein MRB53_017372 [Persea americana]
MTFRSTILHFPWTIPTFHIISLSLLLIFPPPLSSLNIDGILLLSFKYSVQDDPLSALESWCYEDDTPCSWNGVMCAATPEESSNTTTSSRVISLVLPNAELSASIPPDLASIQHLRHLDLSHNLINGTLPLSLFNNNASELRILDLSDNSIAGELPEDVGNLKSLQFLNLSGNALVGKIPDNLTALVNLTVVSLSDNYLSGDLPKGFDHVEILDLSSNLVNGSLPVDFGGGSLRSLNLSHNKLSGSILPEFASGIPANAGLDLSFNDLSGGIPDSLLGRKPESFGGNPDLCGKPLENSCTAPSTLSTPPLIASSPPAIAAIPKTVASSSESPVPGSPDQRSRGGLQAGSIAGIVVGDLAGIGILSMMCLFIYRAKKRKRNEKAAEELDGGGGCSCLRKRGGNKRDEEMTETTESETEGGGGGEKRIYSNMQKEKMGTLVTVDGEPELELETLLKASAYILGASASSIVYKAVLEDGTSFAVRRIGEGAIGRLRDFENEVRVIAKLRHPNLVRIRGFYWGADEKLVIYDYVPNGSLANATYKKMGSSSPCHLSWDVRLKIARGVARGVGYLHEKKQVHGNLKPSNILLDLDMESKISDFGLERLLSSISSSSKAASDSGHYFGSKRSMLSRDSLQQDLPTGTSPSLSTGCASHYHAPESLKNLKPHPKWDVFSFGILLLELFSGKVFSDAELSEWNAGLVVEDRWRLLRLADVALRTDVDGRDEALVACFKLGFSCASMVPQKRPSMKEALQILDKLPPSSSSHYRHH